MTANQIAFYKAREEKRHNLQTEGQTDVAQSETKRHNLEQERVGWGNVGVGYSGIAESRRHNVQTENLNWYQAENLAKLQEAQGTSSLAQGTAALQQAQAAQGRVDEITRHNVVEEGLTKSRDQATATYQGIQGGASVLQAIVGGMRGLIGR